MPLNTQAWILGKELLELASGDAGALDLHSSVAVGLLGLAARYVERAVLGAPQLASAHLAGLVSLTAPAMLARRAQGARVGPDCMPRSVAVTGPARALRLGLGLVSPCHRRWSHCRRCWAHQSLSTRRSIKLP